MTRRQLFATPLAFALRRGDLDRAVALVEKATASGEVAAAALHVRQGGLVIERGFGAARTPRTVFLLASITKPMTAAAVMLLVDRRQMALADPIARFVPEFRGGDRDRVTLRHLLTHTSGLPDMLPENVDLRRRHAPMADFVAAACRTPLLFSPGAEVRYQSMGILLAAEAVERVARVPFRDFLRRELFEPLGMKRTSLGLGGRRITDTALCQVSDDEDWNWNSPYWRDFGAPWGGAHSTAAEVARFLDSFLEPERGVLRSETARAMITNHNGGLNKPWGLGWMLDPGTFGKACSPRTFGHYGSTGTVAWADPANGLRCVLLTTRPAAQSRDGLLGPVSDAVAAAAV